MFKAKFLHEQPTTGPQRLIYMKKDALQQKTQRILF